jgi:hypothetical protein
MSVNLRHAAALALVGSYMLCYAALGVVSANAQGGSQWDHFLQHPGSETFAKLQSRVTSSGPDCGEEVAATNSQRNELFQLIRDGNEQAFRAALLVQHCWDGGEAEDFYRSAGIFLEGNPRTFLQMAKDSQVSRRELNRMVTMLPLETVDDMDAQLKEVKQRIATLKAVEDPALVNVKQKALVSLAKENKNLQEIKSHAKE